MDQHECCQECGEDTPNGIAAKAMEPCGTVHLTRIDLTKGIKTKTLLTDDDQPTKAQCGVDTGPDSPGSFTENFSMPIHLTGKRPIITVYIKCLRVQLQKDWISILLTG